MKLHGTAVAATLAGVILAAGARALPHYAAWQAHLAPTGARAGESAVVIVTARIDPPWHLYSLTQAPGGPNKTTIELDRNRALSVNGKPIQPAPKRHMDPGFHMIVETLAGTVRFAIPVSVAATAKGHQTGSVAVHYQLCNESNCLPPMDESVHFRFSVAPGKARPAHKRPIRQLIGLAPSAAGTLVLASDPPGPPRDAYTQDIESAKQHGLLAFLLLAVTAGLVALATPCVFPMIPITVSYFTKRKDEPGRGIRGALAYCLGIVTTFTILGVGVSILFGASRISQFATNPWVNVVLAAIFVALAANLLGAFEIRIGAGIAGKLHGDGSRPGLLQPFLLGLAFTITSFTCTVPFAGTLLATARANAVYPLIGMLAFSITFAVPFFVLAVFPQALARMPKAGGWMVSVKAVMGLLELAAALKFLSNADLVWHKGWLTQPVFLAVWASIAALSGLYLAGWIRFPHDDTDARIGPARRVLAVASAACAVWFLAGMNGRALGALAAFVPPSPYPGASASAGAGRLAWSADYGGALQAAQRDGKPVFINFTGVTCTNCRQMEQNVFPLPAVQAAFRSFVLVELYTDEAKPQDRLNQALEERLTGTVTLPVYVIVSPQGTVRKVFQGLARTPDDFVAFLRSGTA